MIPSYDQNSTESAWKFIEDFTSNAKAIQDKVLEEILTQNADTEYLRRFLDGVPDKQSFEKKVPLVTYEDVKPYIDRIANGEPSNIICGQPITKFMKSSGTSGGAQKKLPSTEQDLEKREIWQDLLKHVADKYIGGLEGGKGMIFMFIMPETKTPSGIPIDSPSSNYLRSKLFTNRPLNWFHSFTCPDNIIMCSDDNQSMYCQLLCGLVQRDNANCVGAVFASTFIRAIKFLEKHWMEICSNIRIGHVSDWITDADCKISMDSILKSPNPELADIIERECSQKSWEGIVRKLWPRAKFIQAVITGTMAQYVSILDFYSASLPIVSFSYASAEGYFGCNLEPLSKPCDVAYTLLPFVAYFEFLPVNDSDSSCGSDEDRLVSLVDVKLNHSYELVVTTYNGLYRYKMQDILTVTRFLNNIPQFRFMQRQGTILSIDVDKTGEDDILKAVQRAKQRLEPVDIVLEDYTSYSDLSSIPGHYVLYWELVAKIGTSMPKLDHKVLEDCCFTMEESFSVVYRKYRNYKTIGPLEIKVVKQGTFDALMNFFISRGASTNQYKTPRGIKFEEPLKLLDSRVVANFFSQKTPSMHS